jgi:hypothetical protein
MSFDEEDLENLEDLENITTNLRDEDGNNVVNGYVNRFGDEDNELLNLALKTSLEERQQSLLNSSNDDELLRKAIEASLLENQKQNDDLFNTVLYESLDTLEDDDKILEKVIEESHLSNISVRLNTEIINSGMANNIASIMNISNISNLSDTNDTEREFIDAVDSIDSIDSIDAIDNDEEEEEENMKMIIQQIKESEELENKIKINKKTKSIIEEQDFEYEEALRQDIEKEKEKQSNIITSKIVEVPEIPKSKEEMRKLRLAFFDRK